MLAVDPDVGPVLDDSATVVDAGARRARRPDRGRRLWLATWPKLAAIALALLIWQAVVWSGWQPEYILPSPLTVFDRLGELIADGTVADAVGITMRRAAIGYALALVIGVGRRRASWCRRRSPARRSAR